MRRRGKYGRLNEVDWLEIADRIGGGQTHAEIAAAIGVFDEVDRTPVEPHRRAEAAGSKPFTAPAYRR